MKKLVLLTALMAVLIFSSPNAIAQPCSDLFFSEYVEGYGNNKALEIYNPTQNAIDLAEYSLVRFRNGATDAPATTNPKSVTQLPEYMLQPDETYVVVLDRTVVAPETVYSSFDKPVWNGYLFVDTVFNIVTGEPEVDEDGNVIFDVVYDDDDEFGFTATFDYDEREYYEEYDLQGKANVFLDPDYDLSRTMSFNGDDAMALIKGTEVDVIAYSNLVDVIGVIGEDPSYVTAFGNVDDCWVNENDYCLTKDQTIIRTSDNLSGRNELGEVGFVLGGTFTGQGWWSYRKNTFSFLGDHECECHPESLSAAAINLVPIQVYPNPATDFVLVVAPKAIESVQIFNITGQQVVAKVLSSRFNEVQVNTNDLPEGLYTIHVNFEGGDLSVEKLMVK
ncbi:MAG: lamin tail domain-containing protein [Chitinophagales bacterium]